MAIEGSLADVALADICQLLSLGRKTGCLTVTDRANFGYVYFEKGRVVYASVLSRPDRLGDLLVKGGAITPEDLAKAVELQRIEGDRRLGEILVGLGALSQQDLEKWITLQIEEAVFHLFDWSRGSFHFNPDERPDEDQVFRVSLSVDGLLMEGARRVDEWSLIEKKISSLELIFVLGRDPRAESVTLSQTQEKLLPLLDGTRTVRELARDAGLVEFETGKALYELIQGGFLQEAGRKIASHGVGGESAVERGRALGQAFYKAGMLEDAAMEFRAALEEDSGEPTSRFFLGLIALRSGDPRAALDHFDAMPEGGVAGYAVLRNRALALEQLGRFDEAIQLLKEAGALKRGDPDLSLARGIAELKSGNARSARATFREYRDRLDRGTPPPMYYAFAVLAAAMAGYADEAIGLGREGLQMYPAEASILVNTGAALDHKGDHRAAEQYFIRALATGSDAPPQAHKNLGDQAFRRGDHQSAKSHYEQAVKLDPALGDDVFLQLGRLAVGEADKSLAVIFLQRALELNPRNEEARARLKNLSAPPS
jgi:tetratricopeptide (TPR) repeat protein